MAQASLKAEKRDGTGKGVARKLRGTGRIPAVLYGHGEETRSLSLNGHEFELLTQRVHIENTIIQLEIEGEKGEIKALAREVQRHPHRPVILHVDFYQIHAGEKITVEIPIRLTGQAPGVKAGGMMQHALTEIEVRCLPDAIPDYIEVDVSALEIGDSIHIGDVTLPEGVESLAESNRTICSLIPPQAGVPSAEEETAAEAPTGGEPEVIRRAKEDEE